jgi:hypothetical protein
MKRPRPLPHPGREVDQGHPLVAAEESRQADDRSTLKARRSPTSQQAALPSVPAQRRAPPALPARRSSARAGTPRRLAHLGNEIPARTARQARQNHPPPPRRDPQRHPTRAQQRPTRRTQQPHPPDQPPQLRIPHPRTADRTDLPQLHRHRHPAPTMTFTPKPTKAPAVLAAEIEVTRTGHGSGH